MKSVDRQIKKQINTQVKLVESLSVLSFLPVGAEPGRVKRESRMTCMRMLRMPPFVTPKSGEKPYLEVLPDIACGVIIQATISVLRLVKNMPIN